MPRGIRARWVGLAVAVGLAAAAGPLAADQDLERALAALKAVAREGQSNDAAGPAWKVVVSKGPAALVPALSAVDDAHPTAANWLRTAAEAIAEAETKAGRKLPADALAAFAADAKFAPSARRLAFELLTAQDPAARAKLLPGFLNDPSPDLRRDAIAAELERVGPGDDPAQATARLKELFAAARDKDQVELLAKRLAERKTPASVSEHFGFVTRWELIGPFASEKGKALAVAHPPEAARAATGTFPGKDGSPVGWKPAATTDRFGKVDLNKLVGKHKDAAVYALAVLVADKDTPCQVRVSSPNAVQVFVNGAKVFEREEYHHGSAFDHHVGKATLKAGENVLVLKVCQNNQTESWAQNWQFQLRVCDATGGRLPGVVQRVGAETIPVGQIPAGSETREEGGKK